MDVAAAAEPRLRERRRRRHVLDGLDDFVTWFNVLFIAEWPTTVGRHSRSSRWEDGTAGGAPPNFDVAVQPDVAAPHDERAARDGHPLDPAAAAAGGANVPFFALESAISLSVITQRRRHAPAEAADRRPGGAVARAEPRRCGGSCGTRLSEAPYLLVPHTYMPGVESPFTMTVRADDVDDDGNADFTLEPIRPETDWHTASKKFSWAEDVAVRDYDGGGDDDDDDDDGTGAGAGGAPGSSGFKHNPQISLHVEKSGRFYIAVDQIGLTTDGRPRRAAPTTTGATCRWASPSSPTPPSRTASWDPRSCSCTRGPSATTPCCSRASQASDTLYIVVPYLQDHEGSLNRHPPRLPRGCTPTARSA